MFHKRKIKKKQIVILTILLCVVITNTSIGAYLGIENCDSSEYTIESSNENIVCVNSDKTISAVSPGTAKITIKNSKASKTMNITVKEVPVTSVTIENIKERIQLDTEITFNVEILPENANNKSVTVFVENENILCVEESRVIANTDGKTNIIISTSNGIVKKYLSRYSMSQ